MNMSLKPYKDKDWLRTKYVEEDYSANKIAQECGVSWSCIKTWIKKFDLHKKNKKFDDENWLKKIYIDENKTVAEISKLTNTSETIIRSRLKKFNIVKSLELKKVARNRTFQNTCKEKYGVENVFQLESVKKKSKETSLKKYGCEHPIQNAEIIEKVEKTNLKRYGHKTTLLDKDTIEKGRITSLKKYGNEVYQRSPQYVEDSIKRNNEKYGKDWFFQTDEFKEKSKSTNIERYGVYNINKSKTFKDDLRSKRVFEHGVDLLQHDFLNDGKNIKMVNDKAITEICFENNIPYTTFNAWLNSQKNLSQKLIDDYITSYKNNITSIEHKIIEHFDFKRFNSKFDKVKYPDLNYKPDFKLSEKVALNVDGLYWHSELYLNKRYHYNMRKEFEERGLRILQFREDEVNNKFKIVSSMINNSVGKTKNKIAARKTVFEKISQKEAEPFLNENHIKGSIKSNHYALKHNDKIVSIMSVKVREGIMKVDRMCSKHDHLVIGGFSKLLSNIEKILKPSAVEYWVDLRYGTGTFLLKQGFGLKRETLGWEWTDTYKTYNRLRCRANMDERRLSQKEHAEELGWVKIYDAGQRLYLKEIK